MILMGLQFSSSCCGATWEWLIFWAMPVAHLFPPFLSRWRGFFLVYLLTDWATFRRSKGWELIKRWFICWLDLNGRELYLAWSVHHLIPDTQKSWRFLAHLSGFVAQWICPSSPSIFGRVTELRPKLTRVGEIGNVTFFTPILFFLAVKPPQKKSFLIQYMMSCHLLSMFIFPPKAIQRSAPPWASSASSSQLQRLLR